MKTKPILIGVAAVVLLAGIFLFIRHRGGIKPEKTEISQFLYSFNYRITLGNTDTILSYFASNKRSNAVKRLANLLAGKTSIGGEKPLGKVALDIDNATIKIVSTQLAIATVPVKFTHDSLESRQSSMVIKIYKLGIHKFKIVGVDVKQFYEDYGSYERYVKSINPDKYVIYSPITLAAFKVANQLKTKYDSVVWFAHVNNRTFFYVVKGKWDMENDIVRPKDSVIAPYKMGLVNPELKEIIPVEYDVIHNIGGTFPGWIEVEKEGKKGFYDLDGKVIVPANYDQIFPLENDDNLAVLRNGDDYFYLKKDLNISEKIPLKINDFFSKIKNLRTTIDLYRQATSIVTEYNSHTEHGAVYISPSYLADLNMIEKTKYFKNPIRNGIDYEYDDGGISKNYEIAFANKSKHPENWLEASFYLIKEYFLGGRSGFYHKKNVIILDKKKDQILTKNIETDYGPIGNDMLEGVCDINNLKVINDSLFEVKSGAVLFVTLYDTAKYIDGGPYFHYLAIRNNKLVELPNNRSFGFTKYVKMDDSYLSACYTMQQGKKSIVLDHLTPGILRYIKNEIYADYAYQFKDKRWNDVFGDMESYRKFKSDEKPGNANVDDSLTAIDKYNIAWINSKLNKKKPNTLAAK